MAVENEQTGREAGPPQPSFLTLVLKTFAGFGGGVAGVLILFLIFLGASTILQSALNPDVAVEGASKNPLFIFVFMAMVFLTSLGANIIGSLLFTFVEHEKYGRTSTAMYQIFFLNLAAFVIMAPIYLVLDVRGMMDLIGFLAAFHVLLTTLASTMILEIVGNLRYAIVGVYGVVFSLLVTTAVMVVIYEFSQHNAVIVLFAMLPVTWTVLGFVTVIVEMFYHWLYSLYGSDFLMSKTEYGKDYGEQEPEEVPPPPDVSGAEFLKK